MEETDATKRMAEVLDQTQGDQPSDPSSSGRRSSASTEGAVQPTTSNKAALGVLESALAAVEDETDVAAARIVRAEAAAEMDEFDESAPVAGDDGENGVVDAEVNKAEAELQQIEEQVTSQLLYALNVHADLTGSPLSEVNTGGALCAQVHGEQRGVLEC